MPTFSHSCEECDSQFSIKYELDNCDDAPHFCPFCAAYLVLDDDNIEDE